VWLDKQKAGPQPQRGLMEGEALLQAALVVAVPLGEPVPPIVDALRLVLCYTAAENGREESGNGHRDSSNGHLSRNPSVEPHR
jgi:hypothetical protein